MMANDGESEMPRFRFRSKEAENFSRSLFVLIFVFTSAYANRIQDDLPIYFHLYDVS